MRTNQVAPPRPTPEEEARFWACVVRSDGCWEWQRRLSSAGYGSFAVSGRSYPAHRVSLTIAGVALAGLDGCHACHNKRCVRVGPDHLHAGTPRENGADNIGRYGDIRAGTLSLGQVADRLNVQRTTLRREIAAGRLVGRQYQEWFVSESEVDRYRAVLDARG